VASSRTAGRGICMVATTLAGWEADSLGKRWELVELEVLILSRAA
jgi:hypothetical protein